MIHSTAGGNLKEYGYFDIAKVEYLENDEKAFVLSTNEEIKEGDIVLVAISEFEEKEAKVIRIDKHVHEQNFPLPIKRLKKIVRLVK